MWRWDHDAFGNGLPTSTGKFTYNLRFPGQYYDAETGLHHNNARDYNPVTGRYIQSDPIGLTAGNNTYTYVGNNPILFFDLIGLESQSNQNLTTSQRNERLQMLLSYESEYGTRAAAAKYDPTLNSPKNGKFFKNFNDKYITSNRGGVDLDWMLTLLHVSEFTSQPTSKLYFKGKIIWTIVDREDHLSTMFNLGERNAIQIVNEIRQGKSINDVFEAWNIHAKTLCEL